MAATNFTPISLYYSATAASVPTAGNLVAGELALNTADGKLFYKDSAGVVQVLGTKGGVGTSSNTQVLYNSSGLVVGSANFVFDGTNVGIGTSSPSFKIQITAPVVNGGVSVGQLITNSGTGNAGSAIGLGFNTGNGYYAQVAGVYDGTGSAFTVSTSALGVAASERMRITSDGRLLVGLTTALGQGLSIVSASNTIFAQCSATGQSVQALWNSGGATGTASSFVNFGVGTSSFTSVGTITYNGTLTVYGTTSDQRLKTNIVDAPSGNIDDIKVRSFDWINSNTHQDYGLIAQELLEVAPYAVSKPVNSDEMMNVDFSLLVPMMIKEIQDLKQRIATLEAK
jgi:hypothetical protein